MINADTKRTLSPASTDSARESERGAALVLALIILALMGVISMSVLALVTTETRIAGSDLCRTRTFYATAAGMEKMTNDFSFLFARTSRPTPAQLTNIKNAYPTALYAEGFRFNQTLAMDTVRLAEMRATQGITSLAFPVVTLPSGPFAGLIAAVTPYKLTSTAKSDSCGGEVNLEREINNYLIPIFQFGMYSDKDLELHPGPQFTFNGRVHANGNIYISGNVKFLAKVTTANELVRDMQRNGNNKGTNNLVMKVGTIDVAINNGSVTDGPNVSGATIGTRGYHPGSPTGTFNTSWASSVSPAQTGVANKFGGQLQTRSTGGTPLLLPLQLDGNPTREIIKRRMPNDDITLSNSRYHSKSQIRILLDDEGVTDASGIPTTKGVLLSAFTPSQLNGGTALWRVSDSGAITDTSIEQKKSDGTKVAATTVRGIKALTETPSGSAPIPAGSGVTGRILIEIMPEPTTANPSPTPIDVTQTILSMGMTVGEPNAIVHLQRPLWAAFTQGSRDASGGNNYLTYLSNNTYVGINGQIKTNSSKPNSTSYDYLTDIQEDNKERLFTPPSIASTTPTGSFWNSIVPINVYNVREGRLNDTRDGDTIYERGITSVVEINMRNLARWVDGVYDGNLLSSTTAKSTNINGSDGYVLYVSDRRGDKVKAEKDKAGNALTTTNGTVDNEDIYGADVVLAPGAAVVPDPGEDVIDAGLDMVNGQSKKGTLQKDITELPDPAALSLTYPLNCTTGDRVCRAKSVAAWINPANYFRRAVRLYNAEDLLIGGPAGNLSEVNGITVATENMVYIWGNFNTTGINGQPTGGSTLNDPAQTYHYLGDQVPASIVSDAFSPLSKNWFDAMTGLYPGDLAKRLGDAGVSATDWPNMTSVRAGIIAGNNLSAMAGSPDAGNGAESRLSGGMHNFPRFLENWGDRRWNFVGSLIPLYYSTQALGPYSTETSAYSPPTRNWAFDDTFRAPDRLPPGTPSFQYIEPTGFRQVVGGS